MQWQAVLLTGLGGVLAIGGTVIGHSWQAREARRQRHDEWVRGDRYRLHDDRRQAYAAFYLAAGNARWVMAAHTVGPHDELEVARDAVWKEYVPVRLIGHADVLDAATALLTLIDGVVRGDERFDPGRWVIAINAFVDRARGDLIPPDRPALDRPRG